MKFTIVTETYLPFISGVSTSTDSIANFMFEKGHEVTIIAPHPVIPYAPKNLKIKLIYTPSLRDPLLPAKPTSPIPLPIFVIGKYLKNENVDVLHIQEAGAMGMVALIFAKLRKIPVVGALHTVPEQIISFLPDQANSKILIKLIEAYHKFFYNFCDAVMVPTQTFANRVKKEGVKTRIIPISNGVETYKFLPGPKSEEIYHKFNLPKDKTLLYHIGRIDKDKNMETILKAMQFTSPKIHLVIGGKGKDKEKLQNISKELKVTNKISWIAFDSKEEIIKTYQTMDIFVITAPFESQSIVTLEAIACGLPVIAANTNALPELVKDNISGFLIEPYDYKTLAEKANLLASDNSLRKKMGEESRKIALPHEKSLSLQKLENLYINLIRC